MKTSLLTLASLITLSHVASAHTSGHDEGIFQTALHIISHPNHFVMLGLAALVGGLLLVGARALSGKTK